MPSRRCSTNRPFSNAGRRFAPGVSPGHDARYPLRTVVSSRFDLQHVLRTRSPRPCHEIERPCRAHRVGQDGDRERALAAGFDRHLTKPAHPDLIRAALAEAFVKPGYAWVL